MSVNNYPRIDPTLNHAAQRGDIDYLYKKIQENPYALDFFDGIPFVETPLHAAAAAGKISFAVEMMNLKPSFARKLDQYGRSPVHVALENERFPLVNRLLKIDKDLVRVKGREGTTPLHYVIGTDLLILQNFLEACPECIEDVTVHGKTALHLALEKNSNEALEFLVGWLQSNRHREGNYWEKKVVNWQDNEGNTVLHTATTKNDIQAAKLLVKSFLPLDINAKNSNNRTALDISNAQIGNLLRAAGARGPDADSNRRPKSTHISTSAKMVINFTRAKRNMPVELLNALLVIGALIITATYQSSLSPPGGVWPVGNNNNNNPSSSISRLTDLLNPSNISSTSSKANPVGAAELLHKVEGRTVMDTKTFSLFCACNTFTFWMAILVTVLLLPHFYFSSLLLLLGSSYMLSMSVISPTPAFKLANFIAAFVIVVSPFWIGWIYSIAKFVYTILPRSPNWSQFSTIPSISTGPSLLLERFYFKFFLIPAKKKVLEI